MTPSTSIHRRVALNAVSNLLKYIVYLAITLSLTPFIIRGIGNSEYGLWVSILAIIGYAGILEMGVQSAVIKLVAQYKASGDGDSVNRIVVTALVFFLIGGTASALLCWFALPHFLALILRDPSSIDIARQMLFFIGLDTLFFLLGYVFSGLIYGLQLYHARNLLDAGAAIVNAILTWVLLARGGIVALIAIKTAIDFTTLIAGASLCRKAFPEMRLRLRWPARESFRELYRIGGKVFVSASIARVTNNVDPIIISSVLGTAWTAIYYVPKRLLDYLREIAWALATGFIPTFSELDQRRETSMILDVYERYTRYIMLLFLPGLVIITIYGVPFIRLWIGPEYARDGRHVLYLLALSLLVSQLQPLQVRLLIATAQTSVLVKSGLISSGLYLPLCVLLSREWGIDGVAVASLCAAVVAQWILVRSVSAYLRVKPGTLVIWSLRGVFLATAIYAIALLGVQFWLKPVDYARIGLGLVASLPCYGILAYWLVLDSHERQFARDKMRSYARRFSRSWS